MKKKITTIYKPAFGPGFLGKGHTAGPVIAVGFEQSDPFIMLMDDRLEKTDNIPVGGPHPHAGFETVSLLLQGEFGEGEHAMRAGDLEIMTAGSGVVHTETISEPTRMRLLQLWLNLPKKDRHATPRVQRLKADHVPVVQLDGAKVKVYSGSFAGVTSPIKNHTPLIIADITIDPGASLTEALPADFSAFLYVIEGTVNAGAEGKALTLDQVAWLDRSEVSGESSLTLTGGEYGARLVLYAAEPQHHEIVSHGPFIADSMDDIKQLYARFRAGKMEHINEVPAEQQMVY